MKVSDYLPNQYLQPFIQGYKIIESENDIINRVLPSTTSAVCLRYKGQTSYMENNQQEFLPCSVLSGLRKSVRFIHYTHDTAAVIILFKELGTKAFFKVPLYELYEKSVPLENFISQHLISITLEQLEAATDNYSRIIIVEQLLLSIFLKVEKDRLVVKALSQILQNNGLLRIKDLAYSLCTSVDAFEKKFRKNVGTTPKQFSSIVRMQALIKQQSLDPSLAELAFNAGYYDQSHFNKEFKIFTGSTPTELFKSASFW